jgi:ABC-2 type transport system ATP-binding protein
MGLELIQLRKCFGRRPALEGLELQVEAGVAAILAPAGAGKSTLAAILATLQHPTSGTALVDGLDVRKQKPEVRRRIGYLPQSLQLPPRMTVFESLEHLALLGNLTFPAQRRLRIDRAMERLRIDSLRDVRMGELTPGAARRVALAQATLTAPPVLILDEPTSGLDPEESVPVRRFIAEQGAETLVLLLTSSVEDVEAAADTLAVLHQGRFRFSGTPAELVASVDGRTWLREWPRSEPGPPETGFIETAVLCAGDRLRVRGVTPGPAPAGAAPVPPTLADAYVELLARSRDERNAGISGRLAPA